MGRPQAWFLGLIYVFFLTYRGLSAVVPLADPDQRPVAEVRFDPPVQPLTERQLSGLIPLKTSEPLTLPAVRTLIKAAVATHPKPLAGVRGRTIIKSVSAKQRPRRPSEERGRPTRGIWTPPVKREG